MKKSAFALLFVVALAGAFLFAATQPTVPVVGGLLPGGGDKRYLYDRTYDFLEDIKYKDFGRASTYHLPSTQEKRDIPELIRRVFMVKHEVLDIHDFEIMGLDFDRGGARARARALVRYRILGDKRARDDPDARRDVEMLFYWFKEADVWVMELESSLR